jgi:SAM-dependent methyltransferase
MNTRIPARPRGRFAGALEILSFNRSAYALTWLACLSASAYLIWRPPSTIWRFVAALAIGAALFWSFASLIVSHWVYDCSILRDSRWVARYLPRPPHRWVLLHAGLDQNSSALSELYRDADGSVFDLFDPQEMTEPSIRRARDLRAGATDSQPARFDAVPLANESCDTVFLIFAAHELRRPGARMRLFAEVRRILTAGGTLLLVEHLRDVPNGIAFGPGCMHFLPRREWLRLAAENGFAVRESRITPFVGVFCLTRT